MRVQELELLEEDAKIYKLIGPVLIQQDPLEATSNVKKRLEFIQGELDRVDSQLKKLEDKQSKRHGTVRCPHDVTLCLLSQKSLEASMLCCVSSQLCVVLHAAATDRVSGAANSTGGSSS